MKESRPVRKIRMRFVSMSVLVTALTLIVLQGLNYLHIERMINLPDYIIRIINSVSLVIPYSL